MLWKKPKENNPEPLIATFDVLLVDLDGVVYAGERPISSAIEALTRAKESKTTAFVTNNASRTDVQVAELLQRLGLPWVNENLVVTSPQAAVRMLKKLVEAPANILVVGGDGVVDELQKAGYTPVRDADENPEAVIQGFHREVGWKDLAEAAYAIQNLGIPWIATNQDWTIPQERGIAPGNGTLVSAVHTAVGILAEVAGKPEIPIFHQALERFGITPENEDSKSRVLVVGDRLDTDIRGAGNTGLESLLVLTGIDGPKQILAATGNDRPTYIVDSLQELFEPYPQLQVSGNTYISGDARVRLVGDDIVIDNPGSKHTDLVRAASALIWESGRQIYGFNIPELLYSRQPKIDL
ncbi:MAG: HAD-IIA family hydrolase [Microbacteriaceae bacterium]|nr:HAD-IIA family hydrolase [Microbacteriaceae bacterium]